MGKFALKKPYSSLVTGVTGILLQRLFNVGHFIEQYIMYMVHVFIHVLIVYKVLTICFLLLFVYYRLVNIANTNNR
jgi:hypothetical protein